MRETFFTAIEEIAGTRDDIFILTGDLGFKLFDSFKEKYPDRFFDIGVAESNMIGIASGLALSGKKVYCYSIIPFLVMRALEQIRVDVAYHRADVKLIGVGGGISYGMEGYTHFGVEDLALMRTLQNMTVVVPADVREAQVLARISCDYDGPMYIRLGKNGDALIHETLPEMHIGEAMTLCEGKDVAIFAIGNMVHVGIMVCDMLTTRGISATLINMHTLKPFDTATVLKCSDTYAAIFSLEEHNISGGLGSAIAEVLSEQSYKGRFKRIGIPMTLEKVIGHADYLRDVYGLTPDKVYGTIMKELSMMSKVM
jgi:transketolase